MPHHFPSLPRAVACLLALSTPALWAQTDNPSPLPAFEQAGTIQYRCGGIGSDESTAMRSAMKDYPLSLLFAGKNGDYLAGLVVQVQPAHGAPMQFNAAGPVCLLQLPAGSYRIRATTPEGRSQEHSVTVQREGHTLDFRY